MRHDTKKQESKETVCDSKTQCDLMDDDSKSKTEGGKKGENKEVDGGQYTERKACDYHQRNVK